MDSAGRRAVRRRIEEEGNVKYNIYVNRDSELEFHEIQMSRLDRLKKMREVYGKLPAIKIPGYKQLAKLIADAEKDFYE